MKRFIRWFKHPFLRYQVTPQYWRSVWLEWSWQGFGFECVEIEGIHHGLLCGFFSIWHSFNIGQPDK